MKALLFSPAVFLATLTGANPVDDAVTAGRNTLFPHWQDIEANPDARRLTEALAGSTKELEELRAGGQAKLYGPGRLDVEGCTLRTDPRCTAVNIIDKGAAERPTVDPDPDGSLMGGRDDVVENAGGRVDISGSIAGGTGRCEPVYSEVTHPSTTKTCEVRTITNPGSLHEKTCWEAWEEIASSFSRWNCRTALFSWMDASCSIPVVVPIEKTHTVTCYEGREEARRETCPVTVTEPITEKWLAACVRPVYRAQKRTCTKKLLVTPQATCTPGETVTETVTDYADLGEDRAPGADTLTLSYRCAASGIPRITIATNTQTHGATDIVVSTAEENFAMERSWPGTRVVFAGTLACSDKNCLAQVTMNVWETTTGSVIASGSLFARLAFRPFGVTDETEHWVTNCR